VHRSAQLSLGTVKDGVIACPYHGWQYDAAGQCVLMPQLPNVKPGPDRRVRAFRCQARYGYAWVALEEPLRDIPRIPEADAPGFRLVHEFYEPWGCAALRMMENEMDMAHPAFVHLNTFGSADHLGPSEMALEEFDGGFHWRGKIGCAIAHHAQDRPNHRVFDFTYYEPFVVRMRIGYPDGPAHVVVNISSPVANDRTQLVQFCCIEERGGAPDVQKAVAFDRAITLEDKALLEGTDPDVPLDMAAERHLPTDQPGIAMRRMLKRLIEQHG
jgi:phenylpropionate dioxygenase-like ring-hydroxylating dioxygenase large terminal subunit